MKLLSRCLVIVFLTSFMSESLIGQDLDLLSLLEEEETTDYASASFKTSRIINLHSIENTGKGVLDLKISHRFGFINGGISELFGIDQATIRIGADYGVTERLTIGGGRSSFEKTYDGFFKFKLLRQSSGASNFPFTLSILGTTAIKTTPFQNPDRENYFSSRM